MGLDLGADDYVTKPFSPRELVARVRVVLRRVTQQNEDSRLPPLRLGDVVVDFVAHDVRRNAESIRLTPKEFKLLETLANEPGRAFSRSELVTLVFGLDYEGFERTIDVHMMNLRKKIEVSAMATEKEVEVHVRDTGIGIKPEHLPHLFKRFYRIDRPRTRSTGGTGLGLAIVEQLIQAHGAHVCVESQMEQGTCFTFTLPRADS
jgi:CheY-like chemotaxis protein